MNATNEDDNLENASESPLTNEQAAVFYTFYLRGYSCGRLSTVEYLDAEDFVEDDSGAAACLGINDGVAGAPPTSPKVFAARLRGLLAP